MKPQAGERGRLERRGKKTVLSLTLIYLVKSIFWCRLGGRFIEREIPPLEILFHSFRYMLRLERVDSEALSFRMKQAIETDRRGVWLGRHICYKITQVSKDELNEDRNLM